MDPRAYTHGDNSYMDGLHIVNFQGLSSVLKLFTGLTF